MQIINEKPPIYDKIIVAGMKPSDKTTFCYGDTIYNPGNINVPDYIVIHEQVHSVQQGEDPDGWWDKYISDHEFRLGQEIDAYATQYAFLCSKFKDRNLRARILYDIAGSISGSIYGKIVTQNEAMEMIKNKSKVK